MSTRAKELLRTPCPFCGRLDKLEIYSGMKESFVQCTGCHASGPSAFGSAVPETRDASAAILWNKRAEAN